jgi:Holliday junction resolvase-like predicted endonuclease
MLQRRLTCMFARLLESTNASPEFQRTPEDAVHWEKRRNLSRVARQFLRARRIASAESRFDVLAIATRPGAKPCVRLHQGAFNADCNGVFISIPVRKSQRHSHS